MMERILLIEEVSDRTRAPIDTLRYWRSKGMGPRAIKIGRRLAYRESDVDSWIADQWKQAGA